MTIIPTIIQGNLWPLHEGADCSEQLIGDKTLVEWQREYAPEGVCMYANAWVSLSDWEILIASGESAKLVNAEDEVLAYKGDLEEALVVMASKESRLIRYAWDLLHVNEQVVGSLSESRYDGEVSPAANVEGHLVVGEGSRVLPGVFIEGNAVIGKNCKVGPNCYIRGNTTIGDGCHIGQSVEVKNSIIGHGSAVGHLSYVGDSVIGTKVNFGAGTITSNFRHDGGNHFSMSDGELVDTGRRKFGAIVGDGVHTGIHTAIYPGRKMGAGTSTRPNAEVQKDLTN